MEAKIKKVNELMELLGVTRADVIKSWITSTPDEDLVNKMETLIQNEENSPAVFGLSEFTKIEPGMIWYEDNTFSFSVIKDKRIKAVVELIDSRDSLIYGDLTASTIYDIQERRLSSDAAWRRLSNLSSICKKGEEIIKMPKDGLLEIAENYNKIKETLIKIGKKPRKGYQLAEMTDHQYMTFAVNLYEDNSGGACRGDWKEVFNFRPVLKLKVKRPSF